MTAPLRPDPPLYAAVAMDYLASGVGFPLPLPPQAKQYPPKGVTGRQGVDPTPGKVKAWCRNRQPRTNVALRLVTGVIGTMWMPTVASRVSTAWRSCCSRRGRPRDSQESIP